ncbi:TIGR03089 family protein [Marinactinospora thermotolerans]|uniref:TIGR03089 family protein n=1 Tax=Marinactinospora thermotolerans DSM 45154 TaxID=1122192 RepID=A0A1T4QLZ0_9ACTN|nr:TIGR03089 family protein [Marinactinospora thermotolerans]SKA04759.1 TIGR03089 family protein [Marinactinospora thermotolerans DSM 45154]
MSARTPVDLWHSSLAVDPARPFVTAYDDATGGRVELSHATFDNWVAKTANLIVDGLGAQPGERVVLALPAHWQSLVWLLACWSAGVTAVAADGAVLPEGEVVVADADRLTAALDSGAREVVGASLHPLGLPLAQCPAAVVDYGVEVRGHGDRFVAPAPVDPSAVAFEGDRAYTGAELVEVAERHAVEWGLSAADRVALVTPPAGSLGVLGHDLSRFLGVIGGSAALILTSDIDSATLQARLAMERATAITGARPAPSSPMGALKSLN